MRLSWAVFGTGENNEVLWIPNVPVGEFTVIKNSVDITSTITVINNGDGCYYVENLSRGLYDVQINKSEQDEFKNIYVGDINLLGTTDVDGTSIQMNGSDKLEVIEYSNLLKQADIVNNLTSTSVSGALAANQGRVLEEQFDDYVLKTDVINNLTSTDTDMPLSANQGSIIYEKIKSEFPVSKVHISEDVDVKNNLQLLDQAIANVAAGGGSVSMDTGSFDFIKINWPFSSGYRLNVYGNSRFNGNVLIDDRITFSGIDPIQTYPFLNRNENVEKLVGAIQTIWLPGTTGAGTNMGQNRAYEEGTIKKMYISQSYYEIEWGTYCDITVSMSLALKDGSDSIELWGNFPQLNTDGSSVANNNFYLIENTGELLGETGYMIVDLNNLLEGLGYDWVGKSNYSGSQDLGTDYEIGFKVDGVNAYKWLKKYDFDMSIPAEFPSGTLSAVPAGLQTGEVWLDTGSDATYPIMRTKI